MTKTQNIQKLAFRLMKEYEPLPARTVGKLSITETRQQTGDKLFVVSHREALFTGLPQTDIVLKSPYIVQRLDSKDDGIWMSNLPCELVQMWNEFASVARGKVLIGGLGLGVVANMCARKSIVKSLTVVERNADVIALCANGLSPNVVKADLFQFVKALKTREFDQVYLDTWQGTGESVWLEEVVPLRRLIGNKIRRIVGWQEGVMHGQVWNGLFRAASMDADIFKGKYHCHGYAFRKFAEQQFPGYEKPTITLKTEIDDLMKVEMDNRSNAMLRFFARRFITEVGSPWWERAFGEFWDEAWTARKS